MTDELKTLKDINDRICACGSHKESHGLNFIRIETLKQEAIKWVKNCDNIVCQHNFKCEGCERFIEFFNLTEEDLK